MNAQTLEALKASIAHWKRMRKDRTTNEEPTSNHCPLCVLFFEKDCEDCPVALLTGMAGCISTPYTAAYSAYLLGADPEWKRAATAEIRFLESLLPTDKKQPKKHK